MRQAIDIQTKPVFRRATFRSLPACLLIAAISFAAVSRADDTASREAQLVNLQAQIARIQGQLKQKHSQLGELEQAIASSEKAIGSLASQIRELTGKTRSIEATIETLKREARQLNHKIDEQKQHLSTQLVELYKRGNPSPVQLLLDSGNPADIDRQLVYLEHINRQRMALLTEFKDLLSERQRLEQEQLREQSRLVAAAEKLQDRQRQIEHRQQQRRKQVNALNTDIAARSSQLTTLEQNKQALEALIEEITAVFDDSATGQPQPSETPAPASFSNFADARGKLPWPVNSSKRRKEHNGVALPATKGEAVRAIYPGRIIFADWFRGQGLLVIIDHGNRYWSLYGHNESLLKSPGDAVAAGETIATVGNSGGQSDDALYFEIRHQGKPINPSHWCRG